MSELSIWGECGKSCHVECNEGLKSENKSIIKKKMQHFAQNVAFFNYTIYFGTISENLTPKYNFLYLKIHFQKDKVSLVLLDAKVAFRDFKGRVVKDVHQHDRRGSLFPCMVAKCFPQGVAADVFIV